MRLWLWLAYLSLAAAWTQPSWHGVNRPAAFAALARPVDPAGGIPITEHPLHPLRTLRRKFTIRSKAPEAVLPADPSVKLDFTQQQWMHMTRKDAELTAEIAKLESKINELESEIKANNERILDKNTSAAVRSFLKRENERLEKRLDAVTKEKQEVTKEKQAVTEMMKITTEKMEAPSTLPPLAAPLSRLPTAHDQYKKLVSSANLSLPVDNMPKLELRSLPGEFSKENAVLPFLVIDGKGEPDLRFATNMTGGQFVPESRQIVNLQGLLLLLATSASGKTRAIFDAARQTYVIYISCQLTRSFERQKRLVDEYRAAEKVFPTMVDRIRTRCELIKDGMAKQREGYRLIAADVCSRVVFLNWLLETFNDEPKLCTPEQFLLLQLDGGQECMLRLFKQLTQEPVETIESVCEYARTQLEDRGVKPIFAIDEAQIAAGLLSDELKESCAFKHVHDRHIPRSLLCAYTRKANALLANPPMVVAGTGLTRDTAHQVPSDLGKATAKLEPLPVLLQDDVAKRLKSLLNVTDDELAAVPNLHKLAGRPRWTAAVVRKIANDGLAGTLPRESKSTVLRLCIDEVVDKAVDELVRKLIRTDKRDSDLQRLMRKMFIIFSMFKRDAQAIQTFFTDKQAQEMLRFGLGQVQDPDPSSASCPMPVALNDYVSRHAVLEYAERRCWSVGEALLKNFMEHYSPKTPSANGVSFETVVAGAIASYDGLVADFVRDAAKLAGEAIFTLPAWTESATLGAVSFEDLAPANSSKSASLSDRSINKVKELKELNRSALFHPADAMRPGLFGVMNPGKRFSVIASTKLLTDAMAGDAILNDLTSTNPTEFFRAKPSTRNERDFRESSTSAAVVERWEDTWNELKSRTGGRVLRIHVALRNGYSKTLGKSTIKKLREYGELEEGAEHLAAVRVKGNEVRVIIDARNYGALFAAPSLRAGIAKLLDKPSASRNQHGDSLSLGDSQEQQQQ